MSDQEVKRSRRAQRRAEQGQGAEEPAREEQAEALPEVSGSDAPSSAEEPAVKPKRKRSKESSEPEQIRDRNKRVRQRAAERRRAERELRAPGRGLDATERVDDALSRSTQAAANFVKNNFSIIQWVVIAGIVAGVGWQIYAYRHGRETAKVSDALALATNDELGRVGVDRGSEPKEMRDLVNPLPDFGTSQERIKAATDAYKQVSDQAGNSAPGTLAKLGLAGVAYDATKYDEAARLYEEVKSSELASRDSDVKGRAIEGVGLAFEGLGKKDQAKKAFHELENLDIPVFAALGLYHQARLVLAEGERDKAKDLVLRVRDKLKKLSAEDQQEYLDYATTQMLRVLDPAEYAKSASQQQQQYSPEQMEALQKQIMTDPSKLQELLKQLGKGGKLAPPGTAAPRPAPAKTPAPASSGTQ